MKKIPESCADLSILRGWEIVREIGSGSNGTVFQIRNTETGSEAALKWIHIHCDSNSGLDNQAFREAQPRLLTEINTLRTLSETPEIVNIFDSSVQISPDGNSMDAFIRMELLTPLVEKLNGSSFSANDAVTMVNDIASALTVCHTANIVHMDIKPENILCSTTGYKLSDFGVSIWNLTSRGVKRQGTPYFQPPEYANGAASSPQGDIYSFGFMLYLLFNNGMLPFQTKFSKEDEQAAWQKYRDSMRLPSGSLPSPQYASPSIARVICKALSYLPEDRYQSARALADDFTQAVSCISEAERIMNLPYLNDDTENKSMPIYLSSGRATPNYSFDLNRTVNTAERVSNKEASVTGFVIPSERTKEKKPPKENAATAEPETKRNKRYWKYILPVAVSLLIVMMVLMILLRPSESVFHIEADIFEAEIAVESISDDASLSAMFKAVSSDKWVPASVNAHLVSLTDLAPNTEYDVQIDIDGCISLTSVKTKEAVSARFTPLKQRLYLCDALLLKETSAAVLEQENRLFEMETDSLHLRSSRMSDQNLAILMNCTVTTESFSTDAETQMYLVLRTPQDTCVQLQTVQPVSVAAPYFRILSDFSPLFDQYYLRHGAYHAGAIRLEVYWLNELLGSADLILSEGAQ